MNTCREPGGWFNLDHVSTSSIPSIVHSVVVDGGNGVEYTPTFFHVQCLLGVTMVYGTISLSQMPQHENTCCSVCQMTLIIIHMHGAKSMIKSTHV